MILNTYIFLTFFTAIGSFILGYFTYLKGPTNKPNRSWFYFCLSVAGWSLGYAITMLPGIEYYYALLASRISHAIGAIIPAFFLDFVYIWMDLKNINRKAINLCYFICIIICALSLTPFVVVNLVPKSIFNYYPVGKIGYLIYVANFIWWVLYAHYFLFSKYKGLIGYRRNQMRYLLVGTILGFFGGATCFPLVFNINVPPYPTTLILVYLFTTTYAMVRYRLMQVSLAITRTGIFVAVYTLVLGIPFTIAVWLKNSFIESFGASWWMVPLILMAILATVGPFIYIYLQRKAEERLLKEQKRYQETLKQASVGMTRIRNLRKLLDLITHIVTKTVKISYAAVYLYNQATNEYVLQVSRDQGRLSLPKLSSDCALIAWLSRKREPLIYEEIKRHMEDAKDALLGKLVEDMNILTATVVIPSFLEDRLLGFIVLGDKLSGQIYTPEDLNVFQVLASQAALAIENAQFYEEAKEMQEQIAQAEKMATIGTMADGLSHQINNRFYALSLIAGDTIDTIKMTDTSACSPEVKEMLESINHALGRIQTNVLQGGEVVKGILKYTRKGDEGLEALTLDKILDGTLEMVQYKIKLPEIDIIRDYPKDTPLIKGNLIQLQEAFFNFIDNAYDAIVERRTVLKEEGYRGHITVSAKANSNYSLEITVEDNGMGIKDNNSEKIFTPFFTTKTSSRKGTGLGLYVIRRIITEMHKGKISFESAHKVGTRFIIELPLA